MVLVPKPINWFIFFIKSNPNNLEGVFVRGSFETILLAHLNSVDRKGREWRAMKIFLLPSMGPVKQEIEARGDHVNFDEGAALDLEVQVVLTKDN